MTPELQAWIAYASFAVALWRALFGGQDDADTIACHELVLDALADGPRVRTIECLTDHNLREQVTVEEAERMAAELERLQSKGRWN